MSAKVFWICLAVLVLTIMFGAGFFGVRFERALVAAIAVAFIAVAVRSPFDVAIPMAKEGEEEET